MGLIYRLAAELIRIIYWFITQILVLIGNLSKYQLFKEIDIVDDFVDRVYIILGVLMLFKLVISAIQYLVNPDSFDDKAKGAGALLKRTVIAVALLVLVPVVFEFALSVQDTIVEAIPNVVLGNNTNIPRDGNGGLDFKSSSDKISFNIVLGFLRPKKEFENRVSQVNVNNSSIWNITDVINEGCDTGIASISDKNCRYELGMLLLAIPAGIYLLIMFGSMVIDVGVRTIKFGIIQILAPVPIANYISDEKKLSEWFKTAVQVYADLFIRYFVIYFVIEIILLLIASFVTNDTLPDFEEFMVELAIIIALCNFGKNAPKFVCDLLGIKGSDEGIGNMFKRAGGMLGAGAAGIRTARSNYTTQKERAIGNGKKHPKLAGLRSAAAGLGSSFGRGMIMAGQNKGFKDVRQNAFQNAIKARNNRNDRVDNLYNVKNADGTKMKRYNADGSRNENYYGYTDYLRDVKREKLGIPTTTAFTKVKYDVVDKIAQNAGSEKSFGATKMNETPNKIHVTKAIDGHNYDFTIASARAYASIQVGTKATRWDGEEVTWSVEDQAKAMQVQQEVEKRTSYLKVAELISQNDPTSRMNRDKTLLEIKNNRTSIDDETIKTVYDSLAVTGKLPTTVIGERDAFSVDKIISLLEKTPADGDSAAIERFADILTGVKDGFERARTEKYTQAQAADARSKKTQEAINNNKDSK